MPKQISNQEIEQFLEGHDPQEYIVAIETSYASQYANLIVNDPKMGKRIERKRFKPFFWAKPAGIVALYKGDRTKRRELFNQHNITAKMVKTDHDDGTVPDRMKNGFTVLVEGNCSYGELINAFKKGGVDMFGEDHRRNFVTLSHTEQFMVQTGKRLFKGMDDYDDLHRFQFDLETMGLNPAVDRIFQIGIKDNRGHEAVLEVTGETKEELDDKELLAIETFFAIIDKLKPDIIAGYNSENFDFDFLKVRCKKLGVDLSAVATTLDSEIPLKRKNGTVKYGGETEFYERTEMWGYNIIDIMHAVRRAQAINSNIKRAGLKYITKFSKIAKPNRVYINDGDMIYKTWADKESKFAHNDENGDWYKISEERPIKDGYNEVEGAYIVKRYLLDDLWETEQVDFSFKQADFLLAKIVPTTYSKISTMGTASLWKLIMCAWSYENKLGVPDYQEKADFTGGLSRLLECGFAKKVVKFDYAALYPNTELTHDIFPDFDISGVMKGFLLYIAETRDTYKDLKKKHSKRVDKIEKEMKKYEAEDNLTPELKKKCKKAIARHSKLAADYDKKQLPIKILANSFFGSFGAPYIFPWGDIDCAEETTCRGRQYLRLLVSHFWENYGFRPLVGDTDGFNFAVPDNVDTFEYLGQGLHRFTKKGKVYKGIEAPVAEFNDLYMKGRMGLDIDEIAESTINFARKNYADLIDGEVKLVGNSIKSKKMETYIEEFFDKGIKMLLEGKGYDFIQYYQDYVDDIYNYRIPLAKIASKGKVKQSVKDYKAKSKKKNKAGNPMPRQAHMELVIEHGLNPDLGDVIYYVNTGNKKTVGDIKTVKLSADLPIEEGKEYKIKKKRPKFLIEKINGDEVIGSFTSGKDQEEKTLPLDSVVPEKELTGEVNVQLNCMLIPRSQIDNNPDLTTDQYNVTRYLDKFNKRLKPILVVFHPDIRDDILIEPTIDKDTDTVILGDKPVFTRKECELTAGMPYEEEDQDTYDALMTMEDKEIIFWLRVDKFPNNITEEKWEQTKKDFFERTEKTIGEILEAEKESLDEKIKRLEVWDLEKFHDLFDNASDLELESWFLGKLNVRVRFDEENDIFYFTSLRTPYLNSLLEYQEGYISPKDCNDIFKTTNILKYQEESKERAEWYKTVNYEQMDDPFDKWLEHLEKADEKD